MEEVRETILDLQTKFTELVKTDIFVVSKDLYKPEYKIDSVGEKIGQGVQKYHWEEPWR